MGTGRRRFSKSWSGWLRVSHLGWSCVSLRGDTLGRQSYLWHDRGSRYNTEGTLFLGTSRQSFYRTLENWVYITSLSIYKVEDRNLRVIVAAFFRLIKTMMVGLRTRTIKRWKPKTPYCSPLSRSLQSVTLFETAPAVIILVIGASLSGWIFYIERLMERTKNPGASVPKKKLELPNFFRKGITFKPWDHNFYDDFNLL